MPHASVGDRRLPIHANLENLKKQAKSLVRAIRAAEPDALKRLRAVTALPADPSCAQLSIAQFVLAREHGFASWARLRASLSDTGSRPVPGTEGDEDRHIGLPVIPLRDLVLFPDETLPLFIGRQKTVNAVRASLPDKDMVAITQHHAEVNDPSEQDLYKVGTLVSPLEWVTLNDGSIKVRVQGRAAVRIEALDFSGPYIAATVNPLAATPGQVTPGEIKRAQELFCRLAALLELPGALASAITQASTAKRLTELSRRYLGLGLRDQQRVLEFADPAESLEFAVAELTSLERDIEAIRLEDYVGQYRIAPDLAIDVLAEQGNLLAVSPWDRLSLRALGRDRFRPLADSHALPIPKSVSLESAMAAQRSSLAYCFVRDESGGVTGVTRTDRTGAWPTARRKGFGEPGAVPSDEALRQHVGRYEVAPGNERLISQKSGGLDCDGSQLCALSATDFFGKTEAIRVRFKLNDEGRTVGMRVTTTSATLHYYKMD